jgi:hypothetical protein
MYTHHVFKQGIYYMSTHVYMPMCTVCSYVHVHLCTCALYMHEFSLACTYASVQVCAQCTAVLLSHVCTAVGVHVGALCMGCLWTSVLSVCVHTFSGKPLGRQVVLQPQVSDGCVSISETNSALGTPAWCAPTDTYIHTDKPDPVRDHQSVLVDLQPSMSPYHLDIKWG